MPPKEDGNVSDPHKVLRPSILAQLQMEHVIDGDAVAQLHRSAPSPPMQVCGWVLCAMVLVLYSKPYASDVKLPLRPGLRKYHVEDPVGWLRAKTKQDPGLMSCRTE